MSGADPPSESAIEQLQMWTSSLSFSPPLCLPHSPTSTTSAPALPHAATSFPFPFLVKKSGTEAGRRTFRQRRQESVSGGLCICASSRQWNSRLSINTGACISIQGHTHKFAPVLHFSHAHASTHTFTHLHTHTHTHKYLKNIRKLKAYTFHSFITYVWFVSTIFSHFHARLLIPLTLHTHTQRYFLPGKTFAKVGRFLVYRVNTSSQKSSYIMTTMMHRI